MLDSRAIGSANDLRVFLCEWLRTHPTYSSYRQVLNEHGTPFQDENGDIQYHKDETYFETLLTAEDGYDENDADGWQKYLTDMSEPGGLWGNEALLKACVKAFGVAITL